MLLRDKQAQRLAGLRTNLFGFLEERVLAHFNHKDIIRVQIAVAAMRQRISGTQPILRQSRAESNKFPF